MYVTCENKCFTVTNYTSREVQSLYTTQEEADTPMLLHAKHAEESSSLHPKTQMCSSSAFHSLLIFLVRCTLFVVPKQRENRRCAEDSVPLLLVTILAVQFLECIPSQAVTLLVLLEEKEKLVPWLNLMQKNKKYQDAFTQLGKEWLVPRDLFDVLQEFTCKLYANRCPIMTVP